MTWTRNPYSGTPQNGPEVPLEDSMVESASHCLEVALDYFVTSAYVVPIQIGWLAPKTWE